MIWASQVAPGHENGLKLRIYGSKGGLEWVQADPNYLWYTPFGQPKQLITRGGAGALPVAARVSRVPSGHPEGYLEGFRQHLPGSRPRHPRGAQEGRQAGQGRRLSDMSGRRRRHGLHRGLREVVEEKRGVDEALSSSTASGTRRFAVPAGRLLHAPTVTPSALRRRAKVYSHPRIIVYILHNIRLPYRTQSMHT
jgi:hypothetical protein